MSFKITHAAIIGATGPTGRHLAPQLLERGLAVRVVSRSEDNLKRAFDGIGVERVAADALDANALRAAVKDCDLLVDCIGLPPDRMHDHAVTARIVTEAARTVGARCLQVSSFWGFLPLQRETLDESHPRQGGNPYVLARRAAEDVMLEAGAAVVHVPDFFGPHVTSSVLQMPLQAAAAGKAMNWMGSADTEREYVYVPDAMRMTADLALREEAYGRSWVLPGSGPLSPRGAAEIAGRHLGRPVRVVAAPAWLLKGMSLFSSDLRAFRPMIDDYVRPIRYDATRLTELLGPQETTPYEKAIPETLDRLKT
jgi:nucleoside-diphosphate-sugar epimerase